MQKNERASWEKDFSEFLSTGTDAVPESLSESIFSSIGQELHPSSLKVFAKISLVQFLVGLFSLLFCPQFGLSFSSSLGLMPYLMKFGENVCMLGCGALFAGLSFLVASFTLKAEEIRTLKEHEILQVGSLATLSLGSFFCLGGEIVLTLGFIWILGAILGGAATLEVGWTLRQTFVRKALN